MADVKSMFEKFNDANYFSRVDNKHVLGLYVGLDQNCRKAIELRSKFTPRKVSGTAAIEVNQYKKQEYNTIRFSLRDEEVSGLFYKFCDDLIEQTRGVSNKYEGYAAILNRYFQWKKMFITSKGDVLPEHKIMGLIGEILFLRSKLIPKLGGYDALNSWSGQELTHKDFSYNNEWFEVKAISTGAPTVKISSLEQLESDNEGVLAVYSLEKMSAAYDGITLNNLVIATCKMFTLSDEKELFMSKVALQGYEYNDYYDDFVYEVSEYRQFKVARDFPRITSSSVNPAIKKASYELEIVSLIPYEIE